MNDMDRLDRRIRAAVTRRGRRLLTYDELAEEGASEKEILGRVRRGLLQRIHAGVYLVGSGTLTWDERMLAATLAGGETAEASHLAALRLWGLGDFGKHLVQIKVAHGTSCAARGVKVYRSRRPTPRSIVRGIPCTSVDQSLLDAASTLGARQLHRAFTVAWRKHLTTPRKLLLHIEQFGGPGVKGTVKLRSVAQLYEECRRGPGSEAEADFLWDLFAALDEDGIERPEIQCEIDIEDGRAKAVADLGWPRRTKAVEMMGLDAHGDYIVQDGDVERAAAIRAAGWGLDEVTPRAIRERPAQTIRRLVRFLKS